MRSPRPAPARTRRELAGEKLLASERDERIKLLTLGDRRVQSARAANDATVLGKRVGAVRAEVALRAAYIAALAGFGTPRYPPDRASHQPTMMAIVSPAQGEQHR